jgi:hypothetical protein
MHGMKHSRQGQDCYRRAFACRERAKDAICIHEKNDWLRMEAIWLRLARDYEQNEHAALDTPDDRTYQFEIGDFISPSAFDQTDIESLVECIETVCRGQSISEADPIRELVASVLVFFVTNGARTKHELLTLTFEMMRPELADVA